MLGFVFQYLFGNSTNSQPQNGLSLRAASSKPPFAEIHGQSVNVFGGATGDALFQLLKCALNLMHLQIYFAT